jgi:hypothetical protein
LAIAAERHLGDAPKRTPTGVLPTGIGRCEAAAVDCPYCHVEMRPGWITTRGIALQPQLVSVNWISNYEPREGSVVLAPRGLRRPTRVASCCPECESVVVEPKPAE